MNDKVSLLFFDLEGTLLREETGKIDEESINLLLEQINLLQEQTNSTTYIHLISPIPSHIMDQVLDKLDSYIGRYNITNHKHLRDIQGATATYEKGYQEYENRYDRITPFPRMKSEVPDLGASGKLKYVKDWTQYFEDRLHTCVYAGNGRNDFEAMRYIKSRCRENGKIICPTNSRHQVKEIADFVSNKPDIAGIIDCMQRLNLAMELKNEESRTDTDER